MNFWPPSNQELLIPLKHACRMNPEVLSEKTDPDFELEYIDIGNVSLEKGISARQTLRFGDAPSRARKVVRKDDTLISTVRTYLKAIAHIDEGGENWIASTGFAVLRPNKGVYPRFLYRVAQASPFVDAIVASSTGVGYPAINPSVLGSLEIPLPDLESQKAIAAFLDRETARIDELVLKREAFLTLIDEKQAALAAKAINGAILRNAAGGQQGWFGVVPDDWTVRRGKLLFKERQDRSESGDEELLTVSHITGVTRRSDKDVNMFLAESMEGYKLVSAGDVVVNTMWGWMGAMGVSFLDGLISPSYNVYSPVTDDFEPAYFDLLLRSRPFVAEVNRRSKGVWSSRLRLYPDAFLDIRFPVPTRDTQRAILKALQTAMRRERRLAELSRRSLDSLREFRSALITAAVTGQIDVATWRKRGETERRLDHIQEAMRA